MRNLQESGAYLMKIRCGRLPLLLMPSGSQGPPPSSRRPSGLGFPGLKGFPGTGGAEEGGEGPWLINASSWGFIRDFFQGLFQGGVGPNSSSNGFPSDFRIRSQLLSLVSGFCKVLPQPSWPNLSSVIFPRPLGSGNIELHCFPGHTMHISHLCGYFACCFYSV